MGTQPQRERVGLDKATLEKEWANTEARLRLNREDKGTWDALGHTIRPHVYFEKILIVFTALKGEPQIKDIFTAVAMDGSFQGGLWVRMKSKVTGVETILNHAPQRLAPGLGIFAWVPFFNEVRFTADERNPNSPRNLRMSACFKMTEDPHGAGLLREGLDYLCELHVFRSRFSQYASTRF